MKEFKELIHATLTLAGYLFGLLMWGVLILACVALVFTAPILVVASVYKIICLIGHTAFSWDIPIIIGAAFIALFGLTGLDQMWD